VVKRNIGVQISSAAQPVATFRPFSPTVPVVPRASSSVSGASVLATSTQPSWS